MAHNITERDSVISVRDAGWHGLATVLDDYVTPEEAREMAFPWEPVTMPLYRAVPVVGEDGSLTTRFEEVPGVKGVERSDTGEFFGSVGEDYTHATNRELTQIAEAVEGAGAGEVRVETAGSLKGGRKVWMLLRLNDPIMIKGRRGLADSATATLHYFALQNSHDGTGSFRGQALQTRIICDNTSQAADVEAESQGTEFTFRHTSGITDRIEEAQEAVAGWRESVERYNTLMAHMLDLRVTREQQEVFVENFLPMPLTTKIVSERVLHNVEKARDEFWAIMAGVTSEGVEDTAYGLVQAAIEFQQHVRGVRGENDLARAESRFKRAYLDRDSLTTVAVNLAREVANA